MSTAHLRTSIFYFSLTKGRISSVDLGLQWSWVKNIKEYSQRLHWNYCTLEQWSLSLDSNYWGTVNSKIRKKISLPVNKISCWLMHINWIQKVHANLPLTCCRCQLFCHCLYSLIIKHGRVWFICVFAHAQQGKTAAIVAEQNLNLNGESTSSIKWSMNLMWKQFQMCKNERQT